MTTPAVPSVDQIVAMITARADWWEIATLVEAVDLADGYADHYLLSAAERQRLVDTLLERLLSI